jgi:DNA sulfur modification protein DndD
MIITKIRLSNFGPYLGEHDILFGNEGKGIHLFRGGTGQGKTSLQNSIIWALYGIVHNRKGKEIPPTSILNREAHSNGIFSFGVQLYFTHNQKPWILNRRTSSRFHQDKRYRSGEKFSLVRDGDVVPNPQNEVERLIPFSVNRFFFFDGEMLRDYEELLEEKGVGLKKLKDSIERILGIPFYRLARNDLESVLRKVERERSQIMRRLGGKQFEEITSLHDFIVSEISRIEELNGTLDGQISDLDFEIIENKRKQEDFKEIKDAAEERTRLEKEIEILQKDIDLCDERIKNLNDNLYKTILHEQSINIIEVLDKEHGEKMAKYDAKRRLEGQLQYIRAAMGQTQCRLCGAILDEKELNSLTAQEKELLAEIEKVTEIPEPNTQYETYVQTLHRMPDTMTDQSNYAEINTEKQGYEYTLAQLRPRLEDVKGKLIDEEVKETAELDNLINDQIEEKGRLIGVLSTQRTKLLELKRQKSELDQKISSIDERELNILAARIDMLKSLSSLFEDAISIYRQERRMDVEKEASVIFRNLRSKKDFDKLQINDNFGLSIITTAGRILNKSEWRSAGEEQLVAISLIGALNKCSQINAPVSMDTPFGRLDLKHGGKVMSYLPNLSDQIIIFATDREIRDDDLEVVSGMIHSDYTLEHISESTGTRIRKTRSD